MKFISGYVWQQDTDHTACEQSVVLQQVRTEREPVLLAGIWEGEAVAGGYFSEQLVDWFYQSAIGLLQRKGREGIMEKALMQVLNRVTSELYNNGRGSEMLSTLSYAGMLAAGNRIWLFRKGMSKGYLVNRRFQNSHISPIFRGKVHPSYTDAMIQELTIGEMQKGLGVLLCGEGFLDRLEQDDIKNCLAVQDVMGERQIEKRLRELQEENIRKGSLKKGSAIYMVTV